MYIRKTTILMALVAGLPLMNCGNSKNNTDDVNQINSSVISDETIPETVKNLVKVVAENDSAGFAKLVSYPLQRPYPLHDIDSPQQMSEYYRNLVDDSLKNIIIKSGSEKWSEYGWRGWSLDDGRYIWVDDNVYDVSYISSAEQKNIDSLSKVEIASIEPSIREGWRPIMCLKNAESGDVYRIDSKLESEPSENHFRLAVYKSDSNLSGYPSLLMDGVMDVEGSAGNIIYTFHDNSQNGNYIIQPESSESSDPVIIQPSGENVLLKRAYWHELINR